LSADSQSFSPQSGPSAPPGSGNYPRIGRGLAAARADRVDGVVRPYLEATPASPSPSPQVVLVKLSLNMTWLKGTNELRDAVRRVAKG